MNKTEKPAGFRAFLVTSADSVNADDLHINLQMTDIAEILKNHVLYCDNFPRRNGIAGQYQVNDSQNAVRLFCREMIQPIRLALRRRRKRKIPSYYAQLINAPIERDSIALWGFLNSEIGLGNVARRYAEALSSFADNTLRYSIPLPGRDHIDYIADQPRVRAGCNIIVINPPELLDGNKFFPSSLMADTYQVGVWAWELTASPEAWIPAYDLVNEIWTCSKFSAAVISSVTEKPVRVLPYIVKDWAHLNRAEARAKLPFLPKEGPIFLSAFDLGSSLNRKNPLGAIEAFSQAFGDDQNGAHLVIKYHNGELFPDRRDILRAAASKNERVILVDEVLTESDMQFLFDAIDCFVSLHRGEGFGLNIAEAMIAGRPVICTAYSGNLDFTNRENSILIDYKLIPLKPNDYFNWQGMEQLWAEPDIPMAAAAMRKIANDRNLAAELGAKARRHILKTLNEEIVLDQMRSLIDKIPRTKSRPV